MDFAPFETYIEARKVVQKASDPAEAEGLMRNAVEEVEGLEEIPVTETTTSIVYRAAYDSIRSAVQAFMSLDGYTPYSHEAIVSYGIDHDLLSAGEANRLDRARKFRNDISYRGERICGANYQA